MSVTVVTIRCRGHRLHPFRLSREAARLKISAKSGCIIVISPIMGLVERPNIRGYVIDTADPLGIVRTLPAELVPRGITANAPAPPRLLPLQRTGALRNVPKFNDWIASRAPMGR
jgi:NAD(P)-dependent dehydrogenase (short-subunit alcohol dehydrogenase family)